MRFTGKAFKYGDSVSTDQIFPGRYTYMLLSQEQLAEHALEDLDPDFAAADAENGIIVAGTNWGCGSAREQAVKCLKQKGVRAVVAKSIARIYYRNCINEGLLPIVCPEAAEAIENGEEVTIDLKCSTITSSAGSFAFPKYPEFVRSIIDCGGLIESVRREISNKKTGGM